jgi:alpha-tubulin suppressor-like RCC1 family protein
MPPRLWSDLPGHAGPRGRNRPHRNIAPVVAATAWVALALTGFALTAVASAAPGPVMAWGFNSKGQLGNGSSGAGADSSTPVNVLGPGGAGTLSDATAVSSGNEHSLALRSDGSVWTWGYNGFGQLGNGSSGPGTDSLTPVQVLGPGGIGTLSGVTAIAAGAEHNVALEPDGSVWDWGSGGDGQLGNASLSDSPTPVQVLGTGGVGTLSGVTALAAGLYDSVALKSDGSVWDWGDDFHGELGDGSSGLGALSSTPVQVLGPGGVGTLSGVTAIAAGREHNVALRFDGSVWAWGDNSGGQLGDGSTSDRSTPVQVLGPGGVGTLSGVTAIAAGQAHSLALRSDGSVWAWGGQYLGDGSVSGSVTPVQVVGQGGIGTLSGVTAIAAGTGHSLALEADGSVWAWGVNGSGQLGDGSTFDRATPVSVTGLGAGTVGALGGGAQAFHSLAIAVPQSAPPSGGGPSSPPPGGTSGGTPTAAPGLPAPVLGRTVNLAPTSPCDQPDPAAAPRAGCHPFCGDHCSVRVRLPGSKSFIPLAEAEQVPVGSTVDARNGAVRLTTAAIGAQVQSGIFYQGLFSIAQKAPRPLTTLALLGRRLRPCLPPQASKRRKSHSHSKRDLWSNAHGQFQTQGQYAVGAVLGTRWLTEDRCDGTLIKVAEGTVAVRDLVRKRRIVVRTGHSYLARPKA